MPLSAPLSQHLESQPRAGSPTEAAAPVLVELVQLPHAFPGVPLAPDGNAEVSAGVGVCFARYSIVPSALRSPLRQIPLPATLDRAVPRRIASFLAGRGAASWALGQAGYEGALADLARGPTGAPIWPTGWIGSIAHTDHACVAAVARVPQCALLGVDMEQIMAAEVAEELVGQLGPELISGALQTRGGLSFATALTLVFSAKEGLYKALHPHVGVFFGFEAAECTALDPVRQRLTLRLRTDLGEGFCAGDQFDVRFAAFEDGTVATLLATQSLVRPLQTV